DHLENGLEVAGLVPKRLGRRFLDHVPRFVDDEVPRAGIMQTRFQNLEPIHQRYRRGDSGHSGEKRLQVLDPTKSLPALELTGRAALDDQIEWTAADDFAVDDLIGTPHFRVRLEVGQKIGVHSDSGSAGDGEEADRAESPENRSAICVGLAAEA